jgi:hypothetical protein
MFGASSNAAGRSHARRAEGRLGARSAVILVALVVCLSAASAALAANNWHYKGPVRALLTGENHSPTAKKKWTYTVHVFSPSGAPLSGTIYTEFTFNGTIEGHETPPSHKLTRGYVHDTITFPTDAEGYPLAVQVVVHSEGHSVTLDWAIKVKA